MIALLLGGLAPSSLAWSWWQGAFWDGSANYAAATIPGNSGMIHINDAPRLSRGLAAQFNPQVCDYYGAMQIYINGFWYPYDYRHDPNCVWFSAWFDFNNWNNTDVPNNNQTWTQGWWMDNHTLGQWRLVGNGWVNL